MATKRKKLSALLFEVVCIWPVVLLCAVMISVLFVVCLPFLSYTMIKKRWFMTQEEREALEAPRKSSWDD